MVCILQQCKPLQTRVAGSYIEHSLGDTLELFPDLTYHYNEKLLSGLTGFTSGCWHLTTKKVIFTIHPRPKMGFRANWQSDSSDAGQTSFRFVLGATQKPLLIKQIIYFKDGDTVSDKGKLISDGNFLITNTEIDSAEIITDDFYPFYLRKSFFNNHQWTFHIIPVERYYSLDKFMFIYRHTRLTNIPNGQMTGNRIVFRKLK